MCNCAQDTLSFITEDFKAKLPNNAIAESFNTEILHRVFRFDGKNNDVPAMVIEGSYKSLKRNGEEAKNPKKVSLPIFGMYCPFCGEEHSAKQPKLWAIHIKGPDSIIPVSSRSEAVYLRARALNQHQILVDRTPEQERDLLPEFDVEAIEWKGTCESHAEALAVRDLSDIC